MSNVRKRCDADALRGKAAFRCVALCCVALLKIFQSYLNAVMDEALGDLHL